MADTITIQTSSSTDVVKIIERGPQGPQGPAGSGGGGDVESVNGQTGVVVLAAADVGAASTSHTHGNLTNAGAIGTTSGLPVKTGTSGVLEAGAFGTAAGQFAEGNHTHAASAITSGTLNFNRIQQVLTAQTGSDDIDGPDIYDAAPYLVGGNLHALILASTGIEEGYLRIRLPDLATNAVGQVTVRGVDFLQDPSTLRVQITDEENNPIFPATTFYELEFDEEFTFRWNEGRWVMDLRPNPLATAVSHQIFKPNASGTLALTSHTHAASDITSGVLDFDRIQQVVTIESDGTSGTPTEVDLTTNIVGGNLHALVVLLGADSEAYSKVVLPALGAAATGKVTVRVNEFEDASDDFVKIVLDDDTAIFPASGYTEFDPDEELTFRWNDGRWDMAIRPNPSATTAVSIFKPATSGTLAINPMTTAGDIVVGGTSGAPARLALGTAAQQLRVNSGATGLEYFTSQAIVSSTTGITGADAVTNIVSLTQAEYNAIGSPDAATLYLITDP